MKGPIVLALAAALALPALASAQIANALSGSRITISPFFGYAFSYTQKGTVHITDANGVASAAYERQVSGGIMPGVSLEYRAPGHFGFSATAAYNQRGDETLSTDYVDVAPLNSPGSSLWFLRGALTVALTDNGDMSLHRSVGQIAVGPTMVHEVPASATGRPAVNAYGVSGSASMDLPLPVAGMSFRAAVDDYTVFLPMAGVARQLAGNISDQFGVYTGTDLTGGQANIVSVRAGLSISF